MYKIKSYIGNSMNIFLFDVLPMIPERRTRQN